MIEKVFSGGNILTQEPTMPAASAFAVSSGKTVAVGSDQEILPLQTTPSSRSDFKKQTVIPGFIDSHIHLWKVGNLLTYLLDLRGVKSIEEMQQLLLDYARKNPQLEWIQARGFNEALFADKRMPTKRDLDAVITDRPVCVMRTCAHQLIVNTKALEAAGINSFAAGPPGGEIKKFDNGELKGHFTETALGLVMNKIPAYTFHQYREMILAAQQEMLKRGITAVTDPAVLPDLLEVYRSMDRNGELVIRVNAIAIRVPDGAAQALPLPAKHHSAHLKIDTVKFFADGGLSGKTAALKNFYRNSKERGVLRLREDFFWPLALEAQQAGFRIATHAIGDQAIEVVLNVYKRLAKEDASLHHRIEHLGLPSVENLQAMQQLNVSAVMQPIFIKELGVNFRDYLGNEYLDRVYPAKSVLKAGVPLAFSTDAPVVKELNPFAGLQAAIDRKDETGEVIGINERVTLSGALTAYTLGSAAANHDAKVSGSITAGKYADFLILNENPYEANDLSSLNIKAVYVAGKEIFRN
jgi:hypothetical protein